MRKIVPYFIFGYIGSSSQINAINLPIFLKVA